MLCTLINRASHMDITSVMRSLVCRLIKIWLCCLSQTFPDAAYVDLLKGETLQCDSLTGAIENVQFKLRVLFR